MIAAVRAVSEQLEFGARNLKRAVRDLTPQQLAHVPPGLANSIANLVLHIGATEVEIAGLLSGREAPTDVQRGVLLDRYQPGPGNPIAAAPEGETSESLLARFDRARAVLGEALEGLTDADLERTFTFGGGRPIPAGYFLSLLPFHLASHYGQIQLIRRFLQ